MEVSDTPIPANNGHPSRQAHGAENGLDGVWEIQRARIVRAMTEVCAEHGASNVTVAHVVARSGVSRRTFYELFVDREACFLAAVDDALGRASDYVLPAYDGAGRWRDRVRASLAALLEFLDEEPFMGHLLVVETLGAGPVALERRQRVIATMTTAVGQGVREAKAGLSAPPLTAEGLVGGVLSVLHARLARPDSGRLLELTSTLMSMIVLPYLGAAAARQELQRPIPVSGVRERMPVANPLRDLEMRLTYRTVRVLMSVASHPGSSNREIGLASGIQDQGQISKLLARLTKLGLIENAGAGQTRGAPNEWTLTRKGLEIEQAVRAPASA